MVDPVSITIATVGGNLLESFIQGLGESLGESSGEFAFSFFFQQEENSSALAEMIGKSLEEQSRLMREAIEQWQATQVQLNLQKIQADWDRDNGSCVINVLKY